jgi:D-arginine dehydrogenase
VVTAAEVVGLCRSGSGWLVRTPRETFGAAVVVNAAGAWCDEIGRLAAARPLGLSPKRRTAITFDASDGSEVRRWPVVVDVDEKFYFKPDAGRVLASPADETPTAPCDAAPQDYDVALAAARVEMATTLSVRHIRRKWAGLRSFVADKTPVAGEDASLPGFFWLAGQGGYGIMTSPAMARATAGLIFEGRLPDDLSALGLSAQQLSPERFGRA